jgi:hypothetical protein
MQYSGAGRASDGPVFDRTLFLRVAFPTIPVVYGLSGKQGGKR